jgi:ferredoxin, 2Fe-2S
MLMPTSSSDKWMRFIARHTIMSATIRFISRERGGAVELPAKVGQTVLEVALANGISIDHACGGVCGCSTCHVIVRNGMSLLSDAEDQELDRVEQAPGNRPESRLACQARLAREGTITCEIPGWNRNLVRET